MIYAVNYDSNDRFVEKKKTISSYLKNQMRKECTPFPAVSVSWRPYIPSKKREIHAVRSESLRNCPSARAIHALILRHYARLVFEDRKVKRRARTVMALCIGVVTNPEKCGALFPHAVKGGAVKFCPPYVHGSIDGQESAEREREMPTARCSAGGALSLSLCDLLRNNWVRSDRALG